MGCIVAVLSNPLKSYHAPRPGEFNILHFLPHPIDINWWNIMILNITFVGTHEMNFHFVNRFMISVLPYFPWHIFVIFLCPKVTSCPCCCHRRQRRMNRKRWQLSGDLKSNIRLMVIRERFGTGVIFKSLQKYGFLRFFEELPGFWSHCSLLAIDSAALHIDE